MKKVLILAGSPRIHGNSDKLCDAFMKGAQEAGHDVKKIHITQKHIHYCIGCGMCQKNGGTCVQRDDMEQILTEMIESDVIVMATPVYFYNMSAQMKTLIDRTCPRYTELGNKDYYILMSAAEKERASMQHVVESFRGFFDCLDNAREAGIIYGLGAYEVDEIVSLPVMKEAYEAGKAIS